MTPDGPIDPKPVPPQAPESWECCQSGCEPCVFDRYWDALSLYEAALKAWEQRHPEAQSGIGN